MSVDIRKAVEKYKQDKNDLRLSILLETFDKKSTKANLDSLKLLIEDNDLRAVRNFLGQTGTEPDTALENFPHEQNELIRNAKLAFGDPTDMQSLGNKILDGRISRGAIASHYRPTILLKKFATVAGKDYVEIEEFPTSSPGDGVAPIWEFGILGVARINRMLEHRVN